MHRDLRRNVRRHHISRRGFQKHPTYWSLTSNGVNYSWRRQATISRKRTTYPSRSTGKNAWRYPWRRERGVQTVLAITHWAPFGHLPLLPLDSVVQSLQRNPAILHLDLIVRGAYLNFTQTLGYFRTSSFYVDKYIDHRSHGIAF